MGFASRNRLLKLARRDYRPNAWRRQDDLDELLSEFHAEFSRLSEQYGIWIPYSMPTVDAVRDALLDGTIQRTAVPQVIENAYMRAFEHFHSRVTRSVVSMAINHVLHAGLVAINHVLPPGP